MMIEKHGKYREIPIGIKTKQNTAQWCCQEVHQYLEESYRNPSSLLVTLPGTCL